MLLPKIKKIPENTNGRLAIPALAGLLVQYVNDIVEYIVDVHVNLKHIRIKIKITYIKYYTKL